MTLQHPDSLRAILDSVFAAPAYHWIERPEHFTWLRHAWAAFSNWLGNLDTTHPVGFRIVVYLVGAIMLGVVLHAGWRFVHEVRAAPAAGEIGGAAATRRDEAWYRREADRLAREGHFPEAIQAEFLALVLALDARQALRFHPSKTPAEYVWESQLAPGARDEFGELVRRLYVYAFARMPCGINEFRAWRDQAAPERYAPAH